MFQDSLKSKYKRPKKGFSLTEVVISVFFFGIVAVSLSLPFSESITLTVSNKNVNVANSLARAYLKEVQDDWKLRTDFDQGFLPIVDDGYTSSGIYNVNVSAIPVVTDDEANTIVRRVQVIYRDSNNGKLANIYYDFNRPSGTT